MTEKPNDHVWDTEAARKRLARVPEDASAADAQEEMMRPEDDASSK